MLLHYMCLLPCHSWLLYQLSILNLSTATLALKSLSKSFHDCIPSLINRTFSVCLFMCIHSRRAEIKGTFNRQTITVVYIKPS